MAQFKNKQQRKAVMRLVKEQNKFNRNVLRQLQSGKLTQAEASELDKPHVAKVLNLPEDKHDLFMKKAFFKGNKGEPIHKSVYSHTDDDGKKWYKSSALGTRRHFVTGKGTPHNVIKFDTPFVHTKKSIRELDAKRLN